MFTPEANLADIYLQTIQPFWQNQIILGEFIGVGQINIAYAYVVHPEALGSVVLSAGRIETFLKYKELMYDLYQQGYSVFIHDHRGQGLSGRLTGHPMLGYVDIFDDYVADFKLFIDKVVTPNSSHQASLVCHSMGGAIGALLILAYPSLFKNVVFSAPMFGIRPALPNWLAHLLLDIHFLQVKFSSTNSAYFWGQSDYENVPFAENDLTHSQVRYQLFRQEYENQPQVKLGGVSGQWLRAAIAAMERVEKNAEKFPIPALVMQAGADTVVDNVRQTKVAKKMTNAQFLQIDNAKHELLEEKDRYRDICLANILKFIANN
ncbi:alpha/beta fold hydrolase [Paraglaciecola sp. L3A3]|uniref:alpha/beta fold hydrolase n=1 Tax=Paraglaciecola sp. L3A3 TaxID=2686358 RepID=UPI00131D406A|nr:alpha/beta fold hydrolase [Paraglaciecola sp. L3A3]